MLQKKDEQRSVELEQNEHSSTKAEDTTSSSHSAKPYVGSRFVCLLLGHKKSNKRCIRCNKYISVPFMSNPPNPP